MGLRFRKTLGGKNLKLNIGKKGLSSTSIKIAKGVTYNSKRGLTLGIPGTGLSYNFRKKNKTMKSANLNDAEEQRIYNTPSKEIIGGYNKASIILIIISFIALFTPLMPLSIFTLIIGLLWFLIDTIVKIVKTNKYNKK